MMRLLGFPLSSENSKGKRLHGFTAVRHPKWSAGDTDTARGVQCALSWGHPEVTGPMLLQMVRVRSKCIQKQSFPGHGKKLADIYFKSSILNTVISKLQNTCGYLPFSIKYPVPVKNSYLLGHNIDKNWSQTYQVLQDSTSTDVLI